MENILYISKDRVDSLFEQAFDGIVDEEIKGSAREKNWTGNIGADILSLIKGSLSHSQKNMASSQMKIRKNVTSRLSHVIIKLQSENKIGDLNQIIKDLGHLDKEWYQFSCDLSARFWDPKSTNVTLYGKIGDYEIEMKGKTEDFSSMTKEKVEEDFQYIPGSSTGYLFNGITLPMCGIISIAAVNNRLIYAVPLCLIKKPINIELG